MVYFDHILHTYACQHSITTGTVNSKMHNNRIVLFLLKQVNNGKCIPAVRGSLGYVPA